MRVPNASVSLKAQGPVSVNALEFVLMSKCEQGTAPVCYVPDSATSWLRASVELHHTKATNADGQHSSTSFILPGRGALETGRCAAGSLFLFDRTQLKSFRRDNHVWKSKAGGKTVQETHEKLKVCDAGLSLEQVPPLSS
jgi:CG-1 domain